MLHCNFLWALPHWVTVIPPLPVIHAHLALLYKQAKTNYLCLKMNYVYECVCCWSGLHCLECKSLTNTCRNHHLCFHDPLPELMVLQDIVFFKAKQQNLFTYFSHFIIHSYTVILSCGCGFPLSFMPTLIQKAYLVKNTAFSLFRKELAFFPSIFKAKPYIWQWIWKIG